MDELRAADALTEIFSIFKRLNKYIDETEPWILGRDEAKKDRLSTVLYNLVEGITMGVTLLAPFIPLLEKLMIRLVKADPAEEAETEDMNRLEERFLKYPTLAVEQTRITINKMAELTQKSMNKRNNFIWY